MRLVRRVCGRVLCGRLLPLTVSREGRGLTLSRHRSYCPGAIRGAPRRSAIACPPPGQAICQSRRIDRGFLGLAGIKCSERMSGRLPADMRWRCYFERPHQARLRVRPTGITSPQGTRRRHLTFPAGHHHALGCTGRVRLGQPARPCRHARPAWHTRCSCARSSGHARCRTAGSPVPNADRSKSPRRGADRPR